MVTAVLRTSPLERLIPRMLATTDREGHTAALAPGLCFFRFSEPTTFSKGAAFGVTLGAVVQGAKRVRIGAHELAVDPQRLLVITRETELAIATTHATPERPFLGLSLNFGPERVARALMALAEAGGEAPAPEAAPAFVMAPDDAIADALDRLLATVADPLDHRLIAPLVIDEILYRLLRSDAATTIRRGAGAAADAARILESMQYVHANHARKLTVAQLARQSAMSPSHFAHRFRAIARTTPMRYLREVRLEHARTLLFETGARAGDVAAQVGFESAAHFTREFKRRFGVPPSRFVQR